MVDMLWFSFCAAVATWMGWLWRSWLRGKERRRRSAAEQVLKRHGLTPQLYLATTGEYDTDLRAALDVFALSGYVITDAQGNVIGKLCPRFVKGPHLRLVVSND